MHRGRTQAAQALIPHAARAGRGGAGTRMTCPVRAKPLVTQMRRGRLPACSCRHARVDGLQRPSGRNAYPSGITRSNIMSPARSQPGSWTEVRLGARAHTTRTTNQAHAPPKPSSSTRQPRTLRLTRGPCTSKEQRASRPASRVGGCSVSSERAARHRCRRGAETSPSVRERRSRPALPLSVPSESLRGAAGHARIRRESGAPGLRLTPLHRAFHRAGLAGRRPSTQAPTH